MPQLPEAMQEHANQAANENREFKALEPGVYTAKLTKVDADQSKGNPPKPMWKLEFNDVQDYEGKSVPGRQWSNMTIEESTMWKVAQFFGAFGVPTKTNTDELIGHRIRLDIVKRVQEFGKNKGKEVNDIRQFSSLIEGDAGFEAAKKLQATLGASPKPAAKAAAPATPAEDAQDDPMAEFANASDAVDF